MITRCTKGDLIIHYRFDRSYGDPRLSDISRPQGTFVYGFTHHLFEEGDEVTLKEYQRQEYGNGLQRFSFAISRLSYDNHEASWSILSGDRRTYLVDKRTKNIIIARYFRDTAAYTRLRVFRLHAKIIAYCYAEGKPIPMWVAYPLNETEDEHPCQFITIPEKLMLPLNRPELKQDLCCTESKDSGKSVRTISRRGVYHV